MSIVNDSEDGISSQESLDLSHSPQPQARQPTIFRSLLPSSGGTKKDRTYYGGPVQKKQSQTMD